MTDELPPPAVMHELGEQEVQELDGSTLKLKELWLDRPAALVFLRHYG